MLYAVDPTFPLTQRRNLGRDHRTLTGAEMPSLHIQIQHEAPRLIFVAREVLGFDAHNRLPSQTLKRSVPVLSIQNAPPNQNDRIEKTVLLYACNKFLKLLALHQWQQVCKRVERQVKSPAPKWLIARMVGNMAIDSTIGAIPLLGDAFDVAFRANMKNMALLRRHLEKRGLKHRPHFGGTTIEGRAERVG